MESGNKKRKRTVIWVIILIVTNLITYGLSNLISFNTPNGKVLVSRNTFNNIKTFEKLYTIKDKLDKYYLNDYDINALIDGAAKGMTEAVGDPYTTYMDKEEFESFTTQTEGNYVGVGIQVGVKDDKIVVISTFKNSPAEKSGIVGGDIIKGVNDTVVEGKDLDAAVSMMKGKKGEDVKLTIEKESGDTEEILVTRDEVQMLTVDSKMIDSEVGYIEVSMFDEHTSENFVKAIESLKSQGMKSLIVDLRGNPGGLLNQTVSMASQFIDKGKNIVYTEDKYGNRKNYDSEGGIAIGMPLTVLTDVGSASASEIFTGAVKDYGVGTIVGTHTFGKGIVQTTFYRSIDGFGDDTALKVTISKYFTPNGNDIHGVGISPDVEVELPKDVQTTALSDTDTQFKKALEIAREKIK